MIKNPSRAAGGRKGQKEPSHELSILGRYMQDLEDCRPIPVEKELELVRRFKRGEQEALHQLIKANLRFVIRIAKRYQGRGLPLEDLIGEGNTGILRAAERFDETKGNKFISYAVWWIKQGILQAISEHFRTVRLPVNRLNALRRLTRVTQAFEKKFGRAPTPAEAATCMKISVAAVTQLLIDGAHAVSLDDPVPKGNGYRLKDSLTGAQGELPDRQLMRESLQADLRHALGTLHPREAQVLRLYYGLCEDRPRSLQEVGHLFQLTRERVRQIREKALARMRLQGRQELLRPHLG